MAAQGGAQDLNVLVLLADDLGVEMVREYAIPGGNTSFQTPVIDGLAQQGIRFTNAWSNPVCSPTRAALLTGRNGFRTGIGEVIWPGPGFDLQNSEILIPEMLPGHYVNGAFGKWHLTSDTSLSLGPVDQGFDYWVGNFFSLNQVNENYNSWTRYEATPGAISSRNEGQYVTRHLVNEAIQWINSQSSPWFCYLAFNNPHSPYHLPPNYYTPSVFFSICELYERQVENMDIEIGRLLGAINDLDNTVVIFLGDNGTPAEVIGPPYGPGRHKATVSQGGVNVPLIVKGPDSIIDPLDQGKACDALVQTTDLFATIADLTGVNLATALPGVTLDSKSFLPCLADPDNPSTSRSFQYTELFVYNSPEAGYLVEQPTQSPYEQPEIPGYQVGGTELSVFGAPLNFPQGPVANSVDLEVSGAPPSMPGFLFLSEVALPTPLHGGCILPDPDPAHSSIIPFGTDSAGSFLLSPFLTADFRNLHFFVQAAIACSVGPCSVEISNPVRIRVSGSSNKALRKGAYKLFVLGHGSVEQIYDLVADPYEQGPPAWKSPNPIPPNLLGTYLNLKFEFERLLHRPPPTYPPCN
jgi:arylsulfatase A-like enzyme